MVFIKTATHAYICNDNLLHFKTRINSPTQVLGTALCVKIDCQSFSLGTFYTTGNI
jgi:hypothetical protein